MICIHVLLPMVHKALLMACVHVCESTMEFLSLAHNLGSASPLVHTIHSISAPILAQMCIHYTTLPFQFGTKLYTTLPLATGPSASIVAPSAASQGTMPLNTNLIHHIYTPQANTTHILHVYHIPSHSSLSRACCLHPAQLFQQHPREPRYSTQYTTFTHHTLHILHI